MKKKQQQQQQKTDVSAVCPRYNIHCFDVMLIFFQINAHHAYLHDWYCMCLYGHANKARCCTL